MGSASDGATGGAGLGLQAFGELQAGFAKARSAKYNAQVAEQNAAESLKNASRAAEIGNIDAANSGMKTRAELGAVKANEGASGVQIGTGSSANVQGSVAQMGMLDAMQIRSNAARAAYGYQVNAVSDTAQAQLDRMEAKQDVTAGEIGAATTVMGGVAQGIQSGQFKSPWDNYQSRNSLQGPTQSGATLDQQSGY